MEKEAHGATLPLVELIVHKTDRIKLTRHQLYLLGQALHAAENFYQHRSQMFRPSDVMRAQRLEQDSRAMAWLRALLLPTPAAEALDGDAELEHEEAADATGP